MDLSHHVTDLSQLAAKRKKEELFGHDVTDLLPTEITKIKELIVWARRELVNYYPTAQSLTQWALMVDGKFQEIGFQVFVDPFEVEEDTMGNPYFAPVILVTGRMAETEFDFDQAKHEVQAGLLDGIAGKVDEKGNWHEPDKLI